MAAPINSGDTSWLLISIALVQLMTPGAKLEAVPFGFVVLDYKKPDSSTLETDDNTLDNPSV